MQLVDEKAYLSECTKVEMMADQWERRLDFSMVLQRVLNWAAMKVVYSAMK